MSNFIKINSFARTNNFETKPINTTKLGIMIESSSFVSSSDFETGSANWSAPFSTATFTVTSSNSYDGIYSALIERTNAGDARMARWQHPSPASIVEGDYIIRAKMKMNSASLAHSGQYIYFEAETDGVKIPQAGTTNRKRSAIINSTASGWFNVETPVFAMRVPSFFYINFNTVSTDAASIGDGFYIDSIEMRRYYTP